VQIALMQALDAELPQFGHHNLLTTASGEGLSKRLGSLSLHQLAKDGYEPMAIASLAVLTGSAGSIEAVATMEALAQRVDLSAISKSAAKFDVGELDGLNARLVHQHAWADVRERFEPDAFDGRGDEFWTAVRENLVKADDAKDWWDRIMTGAPGAVAGDRDYLQTARELLPSGALTAETWKVWTAAIRERTGRKGKELFLPLRLALTGREHGPDMARLLPVIGRERTLARLP
jgi:glutamyl-tRNA synthetase